MALLEVRNVSKYFGGVCALHDVSFDVSDLEILGIIGPNGAGKSTMFNVIACFFPPTAGEVRFNGDNLIGLRSDQVVQKGISRSFQASTLFKKSTVFDNVFTAFHTRYHQPPWKAFLHTASVRAEEKIAREKTMEILKYVGLAEQKDKLAGTLSSGYQKLLCIAVCLAPNPRLLLLDEPVTTLSQDKVEMVMEVVARVRDSGVTVVIIEHNMKAIMDCCDRIVAIAYGEKLAEGLPQEIRENKEVVEAYLGAMD